MQRHRWTLLFHDCVIEQLQKLRTAADCAQQKDPDGSKSNANIKLFRALSKLIVDVVPQDPARDEYRQGNTYVWVNDEQTLRSSGSKSDPYAVFQKMLGRGSPPDDWDTLVKASKKEWIKQANN